MAGSGCLGRLPRRLSVHPFPDGSNDLAVLRAAVFLCLLDDPELCVGRKADKEAFGVLLFNVHGFSDVAKRYHVSTMIADRYHVKSPRLEGCRSATTTPGMPSKPPAPSDLADKFMLRMPDGMRDRIAEAAKVNGRSMNAEIVHRLAESFAGTAMQPQALRELRGILATLLKEIDNA